AYCISKTALNGVTAQLAAALPKFAVNSVCPGWVRTDMGGPNATGSVGEGATRIVWLAVDAPQNETGKFWRDRNVIPWCSETRNRTPLLPAEIDLHHDRFLAEVMAPFDDLPAKCVSEPFAYMCPTIE